MPRMKRSTRRRNIDRLKRIQKKKSEEKKLTEIPGSSGMPYTHVNIRPVYQRPAGRDMQEADMYNRMGRIMMNALLRMGVSEKAIRRSMQMQEVENRWSANDGEYLRAKAEKRRIEQQNFMNSMPQNMTLSADEAKLKETEQKKGRRDERSLDPGQRNRPKLEALSEDELRTKPKLRSVKAIRAAGFKVNPKEESIRKSADMEDASLHRPRLSPSAEEILYGENHAEAQEEEAATGREARLEEPEKEEPKTNVYSLEEFLGENEEEEVEEGQNPEGAAESLYGENREEVQEEEIASGREARPEEPEQEEQKEEEPGQSDVLAGGVVVQEENKAPEDDKLSREEQIASRQYNAQMLRRMQKAKLDQKTQTIIQSMDQTGHKGKGTEGIDQAVDAITEYWVGDLSGTTDREFVKKYGEYLKFRKLREGLKNLLSQEGIADMMSEEQKQRVEEVISKEGEYKKLDDYADERVKLLTDETYAGHTMAELRKYKEDMKSMLRSLEKNKVKRMLRNKPGHRNALRVMGIIDHVEKLQAGFAEMVRAAEKELEAQVLGNDGLNDVPDDFDMEKAAADVEQYQAAMDEMLGDTQELVRLNRKGELNEEEDVDEIMGEPKVPENDAEVEQAVKEIEELIEGDDNNNPMADMINFVKKIKAQV